MDDLPDPRELARIVLDREWHPGHLDAAGHLLIAQADEIESLRARLAQAEAQLEAARQRMGERSAQAAEQIRLRALAEIKRDAAEVALATARRDALNEAADAIEKIPSMHAPVHGDSGGFAWKTGIADAAQLVRARVALVVADTGEGLSKTSAKPLVVADTPEQPTCICGYSDPVYQPPEAHHTHCHYRLGAGLAGAPEQEQR